MPSGMDTANAMAASATSAASMTQRQCHGRRQCRRVVALALAEAEAAAAAAAVKPREDINEAKAGLSKVGIAH